MTSSVITVYLTGSFTFCNILSMFTLFVFLIHLDKAGASVGNCDNEIWGAGMDKIEAMLYAVVNSIMIAYYLILLLVIFAILVDMNILH